MFESAPHNAKPKEFSIGMLRPQMGHVQEVCNTLAALVLPKPMAYSAPRFSTRVDHFFVKPGESFGPVSVVASVRRFFCYSAQYGDGSQSVVLLVGDSVQQALSYGGLGRVFSSLGEHSRRNGLVTSHLLTSINTPKTLGEFHERTALTNSCHQLRDFLFEAVRSDVVDPPPLNVLNVNLWDERRFFHNSCRCTLEEMPDNEGVLLRVQWMRSGGHEKRIALVGRGREVC